MKKHFTYIIYSPKYNLYYIGSTSDLADRIKRHNENRSIYTKGKGPWEIKAIIEFDNKSESYRLN